MKFDKMVFFKWFFFTVGATTLIAGYIVYLKLGLIPFVNLVFLKGIVYIAIYFIFEHDENEKKLINRIKVLENKQREKS